MDEGIHICIPGEPKPQARTKSRAFYNKKRNQWMAQTYDPKGPSADYRARITHEAALAMAGRPPWSEPVRLRATFYLPKPKSKAKKKRWPNVNPDIDNYLKALLDGLQGVVFDDDKQVCELIATKAYALENLPVCTHVTVVTLRKEVRQNGSTNQF